MRGGGRDVMKIYYDTSEEEYFANSKSFELLSFKLFIASLEGFILEKQFIQKGPSHDLNPTSLNTLRIMTMIDPVTAEPFIAAALHRMGSSNSSFADNWSQGGLSALIDINSGKMGKAIQYPFKGKVEYHSFHPHTHRKIEGEIIPNWNEIKAVVLRCASFVYFMPLIGWDVVVSDGQPYILEGNYNPDINLIQVHQPLLTNSKIKDFYKYHKVIRE